MNKGRLITILAVAMLATSCGTNEENSSVWKPGQFALDDADQPTLKNPQGIYNNLGKMRATQGKSGLPQSGEANILVVPIEFSGDDDSGYAFSSGDTSILDKVFFTSRGASTSLPSVVNYYEESSYGELRLSGVVSPVITLENEFVDYLSDSIYFGLDYVLKEITDYVYNYLFVKTETYNLEDFDSNDDGKIDSLVLAYSWLPREAYYQTNMYEYVYEILSDKVAFGSEINLESPVNSISWQSARVSKLTGTSNDSHIAINHIGKMIGIEDYSDTTGDMSGYLRAPLAHRDMMDGKIGDHNPFTKYQLGWVKPTIAAASKIDSEKTYILEPYESEGDVLILSPEETGLYGEYLMLEYYTPTDLYGPDASKAYPYNLYGNKNYSKPGVRVYKVDSRLVEGTSASDVSLADGDPDFEKQITLDNGKKTTAYYDYAYSNNGINEYSDSGIYEDYPLVEELSKKGFNRHMTDSLFSLDDDDIYFAGDTFGTENDACGFYKDFALDGNGNGELLLGLNFKVDSISDSSAKITVRRTR